MNDYRPRRAGKRWREGAPEYILDCFDNRGETCDHYTVMFWPERGTRRDVWVQYLGMSDAPSHPQGVSMWGELSAHDAANYRYRVKHQRVRWLDLPEHIRQHVVARYEED